ncbi:helix-turn-helix domain-containing protein, partial [Turicimonas muris]
SVLSAEVVRGHKNLLSLGSLRADEKLASFLLDLSQRYEARGYSRTEFILRMTRGEIGSFLGLKLETVSRVLSKFADSNLIEIHQKRVHILNLAGLKAILTEECRPE